MRKIPSEAVAAIESPKLNITLVMLPSASLLGKRLAINVYPGKKSAKGTPKTMRRMLDGKNIMITTSRIVRIFMSRRSF